MFAFCIETSQLFNNLLEGYAIIHSPHIWVNMNTIAKINIEITLKLI